MWIFPLAYPIISAQHKYFEFILNSVAFMYLWIIFAFQSDNGCILLGALYGKTKLCPSVSPKKTWEGVSGGISK
jgi:phosphatidate cytidylyltransferase